MQIKIAKSKSFKISTKGQAKLVTKKHGCFEVQINDKGRELVNGVRTSLHDLTGV